MFELANLKYLELLKGVREEELNNLIENGNTFPEIKESLEACFFQTEFQAFREESNSLIGEKLESINWGNGKSEEIAKAVEQCSSKSYHVQERLKEACNDLRDFRRTEPPKVLLVLCLLIEIDCLRRRIVALKKEAGILREE